MYTTRADYKGKEDRRGVLDGDLLGAKPDS